MQDNFRPHGPPSIGVSAKHTTRISALSLTKPWGAGGGSLRCIFSLPVITQKGVTWNKLTIRFGDTQYKDGLSMNDTSIKNAA